MPDTLGKALITQKNCFTSLPGECLIYILQQDFSFYSFSMKLSSFLYKCYPASSPHATVIPKHSRFHLYLLMKFYSFQATPPVCQDNFKSWAYYSPTYIWYPLCLVSSEDLWINKRWLNINNYHHVLYFIPRKARHFHTKEHLHSNPPSYA